MKPAGLALALVLSLVLWIVLIALVLAGAAWVDRLILAGRQ